MNPMTPIQSTDNFAELTTCDRKIRRLGFAVVFLTFGVFGIWAAFAPLDGAAYAPGVVTVQAYRKRCSTLKAASSRRCWCMTAILSNRMTR